MEVGDIAQLGSDSEGPFNSEEELEVRSFDFRQDGRLTQGCLRFPDVFFSPDLLDGGIGRKMPRPVDREVNPVAFTYSGGQVQVTVPKLVAYVGVVVN
jgi:hypothetical protein